MSAGKAITVRGTQLVKRHFKERQAEGEKERGTRRRGVFPRRRRRRI